MLSRCGCTKLPKLYSSRNQPSFNTKIQTYPTKWAYVKCFCGMRSKTCRGYNIDAIELEAVENWNTGMKK